MADRYERILAVLAKLETTEGTDSEPSGAADALQISNVSFTPVAGEEVSRDLVQPYLGSQGIILVGSYIQIEFDVEMAGAGAAGTAPAYGPLLRACGMSETINADVSVEYDPVSDGFESMSLYYVQAGVRHIALGSRGTFTLSVVPKQIPKIRFSIMGLLGTISDQAMPSVNTSAFVSPVIVSKAQTTFSLHGAERVTESINLDLSGTVTPRFLIGEEKMAITNRQSTGTAVVTAKSLATQNWFEISEARTAAVLQSVHGTVAGNIVQLDAPAVEIGRVSQGASDNIINYSLPLILKPTSSGNDELKITVK